MVEANFDTKDLASHFTIIVTIDRYNQWLWRLKIAMWLIRLATQIAWVNVKFIQEPTPIDDDNFQTEDLPALTGFICSACGCQFEAIKELAKWCPRCGKAL